VKLDLFNSEEDINYILSNERKICLDFSHLAMSADYFSVDWKDWYKKLYPSIDHVHISDAAGSTSEGLMVGEGIIGDFSDILLIKQNKIIEPWQGHMNEGDGFAKTLSELSKQFNNTHRMA
jgi:N-acetylneuraminate synthase